MISGTVIILSLTIGVLLGLTAVAWRYRMKRGAKLFAVLQVTAVVWVGVTILGLRTPPGTTQLRVWGASTGLSLVVTVLWFGFILSYTGRDRWLRAQRLGIISVPVLIGALVYVVAPTWSPLAGEITQETIAAGTVVTASIGPLGIALGVYLYLFFAAGLGLVVKTVLQGSRLFVGQGLAFVVGSLITIVAGFLVVVGIPIEGYPLTQVALGGQAVLWGYAVFGQQLLRVVPAVTEVAEQAVFDDLDDGLVVVNSAGNIVRTNPRANSALDARELTGDPIEPVLESMGVDTVDDLPTRFENDGRTYRTNVSKIRNWQGEPVGDALIVRDITPLVTREQRLGVLNRILRHNVRNDMTIVMGVGEQLRSHSDDNLATYGKKLTETARNLTDVSEKAIEIERMFGTSMATGQVDLSTTMDETVSRLSAEYPAATVITSVDAETVRTDRQILISVIEEVVTNALEHAGDEPAVRIEAAPTDAGTEITVTDDGPGIPDAELRPVTAGEETALKHASSFGLWFVTWGVQALGGTVDIETMPSGTRVTLTISDLKVSDEDRETVDPDSPLTTE